MNFNNHEKGIRNEYFNIEISMSTMMVLENANKRMKRFKQVYINEGLLIKAIFDLNDDMTNSIIDDMDVTDILEILSSPRDMIVSLKNYSLPEFTSSEVMIRKATLGDAISLKNFVKAEFGNSWMESVDIGFQEKTSLFILQSKME